MGFGLDGTYRPAEAARAIAAQRPDVVVLSEVDRAWLLNGGHDDLQVLARKLGMRFVFGPAADAVWGDAVLTNLPVGAIEIGAAVRGGRADGGTGAGCGGDVRRAGDRGRVDAHPAAAGCRAARAGRRDRRAHAVPRQLGRLGHERYTALAERGSGCCSVLAALASTASR
jgi:hypothetical protein